MGALLNNKGWVNHPATKMWRGYEWALLQYQKAICNEWLSRGYEDTCYEKTLAIYESYIQPWGTTEDPPWVGDLDFHRSHQSNLLRKDPEWYGPMFPSVPDNLPYIWPTPNDQKRVLMAALNNLVHENAKLMFRNFAGREDTFNASGDRNFVIFLEHEKAEAMKTEGWNIKHLRPREEDDQPQAYLAVAVSYKNRPPKIVVITSKARTELTEDVLPMLDYAEIKNADIMLSPYEWEVNGNKGIKAYLKTAFITLEEDELELKYAEDPTDQTPAMASSTASDD